MKKKLVYVFMAMSLGLAAWYFSKDKLVAHQEKAGIGLARVDFKEIPGSVAKAIMNGEVQGDKYKQDILAMSGDAKFHSQLGQRLYTLAMSKGYYSQDKINILKAAKGHLLLAKELKD